MKVDPLDISLTSGFYWVIEHKGIEWTVSWFDPVLGWMHCGMDYSSNSEEYEPYHIGPKLTAPE